jgi:hypothetical protein
LFQFKYDWALLFLLFHAAWGAFSDVLSGDGRELGAVLTIQTAGKTLKYAPLVHGILSHGFRKEWYFSPSPRST